MDFSSCTKHTYTLDGNEPLRILNDSIYCYNGVLYGNESYYGFLTANTIDNSNNWSIHLQAKATGGNCAIILSPSGTSTTDVNQVNFISDGRVVLFYDGAQELSSRANNLNFISDSFVDIIIRKTSNSNFEVECNGAVNSFTDNHIGLYPNLQIGIYSWHDNSNIQVRYLLDRVCNNET